MVRYQGLIVHVPIDSVVFLAGGIPSLELVSQLISAARRAIESFKAGLIAKKRGKRSRKVPGQSARPEDDVLSPAARRNKLADAS